MKYLKILILSLVVVSCSKEEIEVINSSEIGIIPENPVIPVEADRLDDGTYAGSYVSKNLYDTFDVVDFETNLLNYHPSAGLIFKDSLLVKTMTYSRIDEFWNIDNPNMERMLREDVRYLATTEYSTYMGKNDSLPYIKEVEIVNSSVIKLTIRNPKENILQYIIAKELEEDEITYIDDYYSNTGFFRDSLYAELDAFNFNSLLNGFIADAKRHGVDLSNVDVENSKLILEEDPFAPAWVTWETGCNPNLSQIHYAKDLWETGGIYDKNAGKLLTMWHEFGHDLLLNAHWAAGGQIMTSSVGPKGSGNSCETSMYDLSMNSSEYCRDFERAVDDLFAHFKEFQDSGIVGEYMKNCN